MPDRYRFPGFTPFLRLAEAGVTDLSILSHARRQPALAALASLCAQAADAPAEHVAEIFAHGLKARDGLAIALDAANALVAEVADELGLDGPATPPGRGDAAALAGVLEARDAEIAELKREVTGQAERLRQADAELATLRAELAAAKAATAPVSVGVPAPATAPTPGVPAVVAEAPVPAPAPEATAPKPAPKPKA